MESINSGSPFPSSPSVIPQFIGVALILVFGAPFCGPPEVRADEGWQAVKPRPHGENDVHALIEQLESENAEKQVQAAVRLARIGSAAQPAVGALTQLLKDDEPVVRAYAAMALWEIDGQIDSTSRADGRLIKVLAEVLRSNQPGVPAVSAYFLGSLGPTARPALPELRQALQIDNPKVRVHVAEAIANIDPSDPAAVETLVQLLQQPNREVRVIAAYALGGPEALDPESGLVHHPPSPLAGPSLPSPDVPQVAPADSPGIQWGSGVRAVEAPVPLNREDSLVPAAGIRLAVQTNGDNQPASGGDVEARPKSPFEEQLENRPLRSLTTNIDPQLDEETKKDLKMVQIEERFTEQQETRHVIGFSRDWQLAMFEWTAPGTCHQPLLFEDVNLERYGYYHRGIQPAVSSARFFLTLPLLPYLHAAEDIHACKYTLGHFRPGNCAPYYHHKLPRSLKGSLLEAGVATAVVFLLE